jgi:V8-like Glu-specific endopeptidase
MNRRELITGIASGIIIPGSFSALPSTASTIAPKTPREQMLYCTVRIDGQLDGGTKQGTGFIYSIPIGTNILPLLITNNHVVKGTKATSFRFHTQSPTSSTPDGNITVAAPGADAGIWISHPDPTIDLCALPVGPVLTQYPTAFFRAIDPKLIPSDAQLQSLDAMEDVVMAGYPIGLADEKNNYPLLRRGVTASDPAIEFNGQDVFVVDMACFPGSSGSPVFLYNSGTYENRDGGTVIGSRMLLLGILFAGPQMQIDGIIRSVDIPTAMQSIPSVSVAINLGYVIKSKELFALGEAVIKRAPPASK